MSARAVLALLLLGAAPGCLLRNLGGGSDDHQLTGTCDGACAYYLGCKDADQPAARATCVAECTDIFASPETIATFESLSCQDAVEFVDGAPATAAR